MPPCRFVAIALIVSALSSLAPAQQPAGDTTLATLKSRNVFSDEDRGTLRTWLTAQIGALSDGSSDGAAQAAALLRSAGQGGSPAFREAYVASLTDAVRQSYRTASPAAAARMTALVAALAEPATSSFLVAALSDERAGVRAAAATGLRGLRARLAVLGGAYASDAITALRDAGRKETSAPTLTAICEALNFAEVVPSPPEPRLLVGAVLDVLEARSAVYARGDFDAAEPELAGVKAGGDLRRLMSEDEQKRYIAALGQLLRACALRYHGELYAVRDRVSTAGAVRLRNSVELLIEQVEAQLGQLLGAAPTRTILEEIKRMDDPASDRINIKIRWNEWAGLLEKRTGQRLQLDSDEG